MIELLFVLILLIAIAGYRTSKKVERVEVAADRKASAIHAHMEELITTSLAEMREIVKERLDQFYNAIEALETTSLEHTVQLQSLDPENLAAYVRDRDRILKDLTKAVNDKMANAIGTARTVAETASQNVLKTQIDRIHLAVKDALDMRDSVVRLASRLDKEEASMLNVKESIRSFAKLAKSLKELL